MVELVAAPTAIVEPGVHRIARFDQQLAIVIGIEAYQVERFRLTNATDDAKELAQVLRDRHGYEVEALYDEAATFRALARLFGLQLHSRVTEATQLLVFFAGHGLAHEMAEGLDGFLLPVDAQEDRRNWLPMKFLRRQLAKLPCHHLLVILDCCFAGSFARPRFRDVAAEQPALTRELYDHYLDRPARQLLASCAYDERALDRLSTERAPFTPALVGALGRPDPDDLRADPDRDGVVTAPDLYGYLRKQLVKVRGVAQTPNLWPLAGHDVGEYVFTTAAPRLERAPPLAETRNPYVGLRHFRKDDADVFMGRDTFVRLLVEHAAAAPLTVVLGPAGAGKSSVLHAGLHAALERTGTRVLGPIAVGASPLFQLAQLVTGKATEGTDRVCVIVDQLDELTGARREQRGLFQLLLALLVPGDHDTTVKRALLSTPIHLWPLVWGVAMGVERLRGRASLVLALRSDVEPYFLGAGALGAVLDATWRAARLVLPAMNRDELRQCVEGPAAQWVVFFTAAAPAKPRADGEQRLVDVILDEVDQTPDALPLLSVALERMFESFHRRGPANRTIDWTDYDGVGGIPGALQDLAERLYERGALDDADPLAGDELIAFQHTLRRVMLRMIAWRGRTPIRRAVARADLTWTEPGETARADRVIALLLAKRLIATVRDAGAAATADAPLADGESIRSGEVQPVHDALLTGWPRLQVWIDERRDHLMLEGQIHEAARDWKRAGEPRDKLWDRGQAVRFDEIEPTRPASVVDWLRRWLWLRGLATNPVRQLPRLAFTAIERAFIEASIGVRRHRRQLIAGVVTGVIALLSAASIMTYLQRNQARDARDRAITETIRADDRIRLRAARTLLDTDPTAAAAILKEVERPDDAPGWREQAVQTLERAPAAAQLEVRARYGRVDGERAVLETQHATVIWDLRTLRSVTVPGRAALAPAGYRAASFFEDEHGRKEHVLWNTARGHRLAELPELHDAVAFSRDGMRAVTYSSLGNQPAELWDSDSGRRLAKLEACDPAHDVLAISRELVIAYTAELICAWSANSGAVRYRIPIAAETRAIASPAGDRLVTYGSSAALQLWDTADGRLVAVLDPRFDAADPARLLESREDGPVPSSGPVVFSRDGSLVLAARSSELVLWSAARGELVQVAQRPPEAHAGLTADSRRLVAWPAQSAGGTIWDTRTGAVLATLPLGAVPLAHAVRGGRAVLWHQFPEDEAGASGAGLRLLDLETGALTAPLRAFRPTISRDGRRVAAFDLQSASLLLVDAAGTVTGRIADPEWSASRNPLVELTPDGELLITQGSGEPRVWDAVSGELLATLRGGGKLYSADSIAEHGLLTWSRSTARWWRLPDPSSAKRRIVASAAGKRLVTRNARRELELWDLVRWTRLRTLPPPTPLHVVELSPDGAWLAVIGTDGVQLVDATTGEVSATIADAALPPSENTIMRLAWAGTRLVLGADDHAGWVVDPHTARRTTALPPLRWFVVSSRGDRAVVAPHGGGVELYNLVAGARVAAFSASLAETAAFSADGQRLALDTGRGLQLCDADRAHACRDTGAHRAAIDAVGFAPDGARLVVRTATGAYLLLDGDSGASIAVLAVDRCPWPCAAPRVLLGVPSAGVFGPNPARVVIPELASWWHTAVGTPLPWPCPRCRMSPGGRWIVGQLGDEPRIVLFDAMTGAPRVTIDQPLEGVQGVSLDDGLIVEGQTELRVWSVDHPDTPRVRIPIAGSISTRPAISADSSRVVFEDARGLHEVPLARDELARRLARATCACLTRSQRGDLLEEPVARAFIAAAACAGEAARAPPSP